MTYRAPRTAQEDLARMATQLTKVQELAERAEATAIVDGDAREALALLIEGIRRTVRF